MAEIAEKNNHYSNLNILLSKNFKIIKKGTVGHDVMSGGRFG
jgi:hypothetical protein